MRQLLKYAVAEGDRVSRTYLSWSPTKDRQARSSEEDNEDQEKGKSWKPERRQHQFLINELQRSDQLDAQPWLHI